MSNNSSSSSENSENLKGANISNSKQTLLSSISRRPSNLSNIITTNPSDSLSNSRASILLSPTNNSSISPFNSNLPPSPTLSKKSSYELPYPPFPESRSRRESSPILQRKTSLLSTPPSSGSSRSSTNSNGFSTIRGNLFDQIDEDEELEVRDSSTRGSSEGLTASTRRSSSFTPRTIFLPQSAPPTIDSFSSAQKEFGTRKQRPADIFTNSNIFGKLDPSIDLLPSPRFRRQYPMDMTNSPLSSPASSSFSISIDSSDSSSSGGYLTPTNSSPTSITSPIFSTLSGIAKSSASTIRRASTTLALASPSPSRSGSIVAGFVTSLGSPISGVTRRGSYAFQAREKAKEKEVEEEKEINEKLLAASKSHTRNISFIDRPDEKLKLKMKSSVKGKMGWKTKVLATLAMVGLMTLVFFLRIDRTINPLEQIKRIDRARGGENVGTSFIHPQVILRTTPLSTAFFASYWRKFRNLVTITRRAPLSSNSVTSNWEQLVWFLSKPKSRSRHTFTSASHINFSQNHPLPPPPVHLDAPERDTLILYRILGNDLPPRHSPGQTLRNLRFLLQHESDFSTLPHLGPHSLHHSKSYGSGSGVKKSHSEDGGLLVDKYFVLNRIAEPQMQAAILQLLRLYAVPESRILVIPFDWNEYQRRDFRWDGGVDKVIGWGISINEDEMLSDTLQAQVEANGGVMEKSKRVESLRLRALDFQYHEKNLYAQNNNGGRNFALQHGRSLPHARWVLPLDGNSFVTPAAMNSIVRTLSITGEGSSASRYLIMPMARLLSNEEVIPQNSIALVPKYVLTEEGEESETASEEATLLHRPSTAPTTPEEPQIGFRYDSTETYQEAMRYGRRSKLEFLWRLGAIPYSRGLDKKTLPWESSDRAHITADTWGSIPGAFGTNFTSIVHSAYNDHSSTTPNPHRGPLAFSKAGWIYRLFSGDQNQERHSPEAVALRSESRIKGIVAFLENLDTKVARGLEGCEEEIGTTEVGHCGFSPDRLWNFNLESVEYLRLAAKNGTEDAVRKVLRFEKAIADIEISVADHLAHPEDISTTEIQVAATNISLLAMAGFLSGKPIYTQLASQFVKLRFVQQTPLIYQHKHDERHNQVRAQRSDDSFTAEDDGLGYSFPPPPNMNGEGRLSAYDAALGASSHLPELPFSPIDFDPTLLLDAIRLLIHPGSPQIEHQDMIHRTTVYPVFSAQLSYLLFSKSAVSLCRNPKTVTLGAQYDAKVAALAAFLNDVRLFGRIANRSRLRLKENMRLKGIVGDGGKIQTGLVRGVKNTKLRPYSMELDREGTNSYTGRSGIYDTSAAFGLLGF